MLETLKVIDPSSYLETYMNTRVNSPGHRKNSMNDSEKSDEVGDQQCYLLTSILQEYEGHSTTERVLWRNDSLASLISIKIQCYSLAKVSY